MRSGKVPGGQKRVKTAFGVTAKMGAACGLRSFGFRLKASGKITGQAGRTGEKLG
jgi:hypothetical protein